MFSSRDPIRVARSGRGPALVRHANRDPASKVMAAGLLTTGGAQGSNNTVANIGGIDISTKMLDKMDRKLLSAMYEDIYFHDPLAGSAVDLMSNLPFSSFRLNVRTARGGDKIEEVFENNLSRLRINTLLAPATREYYVYGAHVSMLIFKAAEKLFTDTLPFSYKDVELVSNILFGRDPIMRVTTPENIREFLNDPSDTARDIKNRLNPELIRTLNSTQIELDPISTIYFPRKPFAFDDEGISIYQRLIPGYLLEKVLMRGTLTLANRRQSSIMHIQAGGDDWDPNPADLQGLVNMVINSGRDPIGSVIATRNDVNISEIASAGDFWKWSDAAPDLDSKKLMALGINESFLSGDMCLAGDTLVDTEYGLIPIKTICPVNQDINVPAGCGIQINSRFGPQPAKYVVYNGYREVFKVSSAKGSYLRATDNHPVLVIDPYTLEATYKRVDQLSVGDSLVIGGKQVRKLPNTLHFPNKSTLSAVDAYAVGRYVGENDTTPNDYYEYLGALDGSLGWIVRSSRKAQIAFLAGLMDTAGAKEFDNTLTLYLNKVEDRARLLHTVLLMMRSLGIKAIRTAASLILTYVPFKAEYLEYITNTTVKDIVETLNDSGGIDISILRRALAARRVRDTFMYVNDHGAAYNLGFSLEEMITEFNFDAYDRGEYTEFMVALRRVSKTLYRRVLEMAENRYELDAITDISSDGKDDVYDLTMTEEPAFVANGFIVHNSYANMEQAIQVFLENLKAHRQEASNHIFYNKLFPLISATNGFTRQQYGSIADRTAETAAPKGQKLRSEFDSQLNDTSSLVIPEIEWSKKLMPQGDAAYLDVMDKLEEKGVPFTLRAWAAAGGFDLNELADDLESSVKINKRLAELKAKADKAAGSSTDSGDDDSGEDDYEASLSGYDQSDMASFGRENMMLPEVGIHRRKFTDSQFEMHKQTVTGKRTYVVGQDRKQREANKEFAHTMEKMAAKSANRTRLYMSANRKKKD